jgi:uncharacterized Ntn-hydrolase superfamily protein
VQGNILVGEAVVEALEQSWTSASDLPLAERLVAALSAGDEAGWRPPRPAERRAAGGTPGGGYGGDDTEVDLRGRRPQRPSA